MMTIVEYLEALTGVSKAMHAMMLGQRGASLSGLVLMNSRRQSAANNPPMLKKILLRSSCPDRNEIGT